MSRCKILFLLVTMACAGCGSTGDLFLVHSGNIPSEDKIARIKEGQSKQDVINILGTPSLTTGLSDDHWIYMASTSKKVAFLQPEEQKREVLAISFENNNISKIEKLSLADGNNIAIDGDVTDSAEREQGFFRKYFGGVGTYMPFGGSNEKEL